MSRTDLSRQPLPFALLLLAAIVAAAFAAALPSGPFAVAAEAVPAPLGRYVHEATVRWPLLSGILAGWLVFAAGYRIGRSALRYGLHPHYNYTGLSLYAVAACGLALSADYLTQALTLSLTAGSVLHLYRGFHRHLCFDALFRGAFRCGILPFLYAPATVLVVMVPLALVLFKRTLREATVALSGLLLPMLLLCYASWALDSDFLAPVHGLAAAIAEHRPMLFFDPADPLRPATFLYGIAALLLLASVIAFGFERGLRFKQRRLFLFNLWLLPLCAGACLLPAGDAATASLAAIPFATLVPMLLTRPRNLFWGVLYLLLTAGTLLSVWFG